MNARVIVLIALFFSFALCSGAARAFELHGSVRNSSTMRTAAHGDGNHDWLNLETSLRLEGTHTTGDGGNNFFGKADFKYDYVANRGDADIRELYMDHYTGHADFRLGKQIITWGSSDLIFVTDVFPKDWTSLLVGRPMEYLKSGVEAARAEAFFKGKAIEVILIPSFTPDILPGGGRLAAFDPFPMAQGRKTEMPSNRLRSPEAAIALKGNTGNSDYSINFYSGRDRRPSFSFDAVSGIAGQRYTRMWLLGAGFRSPRGSNIFRGEAAYYHTEDTAGTDAGVRNPSFKCLLGADMARGGNRAVSVQFGQETTFRYSAYRATLPAGMPAARKTLTFASFRFTDAWNYQTVKPKLFALYDFSERDYYINGEYERNIRDDLSAAIGFNLFGGKSRRTMYGQFDKNDNIYLNIKRDL